jgi:uncharacterized membrane protein YhhN
MFTWPFYLAAAFALLDWVSTWRGWKKRLYVAKPAIMVFLIVWSIQLTGWQGEMLWFGIALALSLAGDILLMLNPRWFMIGGVTFLFAHVAYIIGFLHSPAPFTLGVGLIAVLLGISAGNVFKRIRPGIIRAPRGKRFLASLSLYGLSLTLMLLSALLTLFKEDWLLLPALLVSSGAVLFYTSDTMLVYDRFVRRFNRAQSYVHLTYHLAQFSLITGAVLHHLR